MDEIQTAAALIAGAPPALLIGALAAAGLVGGFVGRRLGRDHDAARADALERTAREAEAQAAAAEDARRVEALRANGVERSLTEYVARVRSALDGHALAQPFAADTDLPLARYGPSRIPIIAFGNLKGGVGKTTLSANLGAYLADRDEAGPGLGKRVLFIDLDFQGSLSATLLSASNSFNDSRVERIFAEDAEPEALLADAAELSHRSMRGCAFFDCDASAARREDKILFKWAVEPGARRDPRLSLARFLLHPAVQSRFDAVILDMPPRATVFAHAALCAATDIVIPTRPDDLSARAVRTFVRLLAEGRDALWPELAIAGVVATMTDGPRLKPTEETAANQAVRAANDIWRGGGVGLIGAVPTKAAIAQAAGGRFAYFDRTSGPPNTPRRLLTDISSEIVAALGGTPALTEPQARLAAFHAL